MPVPAGKRDRSEITIQYARRCIMDEELISKREVLEKYGISYGALYRWKRTGLIPESWFIRKSTTVGQETYFQREKICSRIELILGSKEKLSLDELAQQLAGEQRKRESERKLIIITHYKRTEYPLEQLTGCIIADGEREIDILEYLKEVQQ